MYQECAERAHPRLRSGSRRFITWCQKQVYKRDASRRPSQYPNGTESSALSNLHAVPHSDAYLWILLQQESCREVSRKAGCFRKRASCPILTIDRIVWVTAQVRNTCYSLSLAPIGCSCLVSCKDLQNSKVINSCVICGRALAQDLNAPCLLVCLENNYHIFIL